MLVKLMNGDRDFVLIDYVQSCVFHGHEAVLTFDDGTKASYPIKGSAYLMNDDGKTIDRVTDRQEKP